MPRDPLFQSSDPSYGAFGVFTWEMAVADSTGHMPLLARCSSCYAPVNTGLTIRRQDLPLGPSSGRWPCSCGGEAVIPEHYVIRDARTDERITVRRPREEVTASAITRAELLRLRQAARAVQRGDADAVERLDRVLAEAPEPLRQIAERWKISDKLQLAGIIVTIVIALMTYMKDDGTVTEQQLVELVEKVIEHESAGEQQQSTENPDGGADEAGPGKSASPVERPSGEGNGLPTAPDDNRGVQQPHEEQQQP